MKLVEDKRGRRDQLSGACSCMLDQGCRERLRRVNDVASEQI